MGREPDEVGPKLSVLVGMNPDGGMQLPVHPPPNRDAVAGELERLLPDVSEMLGSSWKKGCRPRVAIRTKNRSKRR